MDKTNLGELTKIWDNLSTDKQADNKILEAELYNKFLNFVQVGKFYYFIFNFNMLDFEFVSNSIMDVLGYNNKEYDVPFFLSLIHPDDQPYFYNFENEGIKFYLSLPIDKRMKYKISIDVRLQKKDRSYIRILHQVIAIQQYQDGTFFRTLGVHTDITHLKNTGKPMLSFIGIEGEPSYINVIPGEILKPVEEPLTKREKEILMFIIDGKKNHEIAPLLHISARTVETHRKNMLFKTDTKTMGQLIAAAVKNGWL